MKSQYIRLEPEKWQDLMPPSDGWNFIIKALELKAKSITDFQNAQYDFLKKKWSQAPLIVGITGSVSVGKSTFAEKLQQHLLKKYPNKKIQIVSGDSFLMSNAQLTAKDLMNEKGFPSSFNWQELADFLSAVKNGESHIEYQVYSHEISDISEEVGYVENPDILIMEGINMLQNAPNGVRSPSDFVDFSIYLDASEENLEQWYLNRFHQLLEINKNNPGNFFYQWAHYPRVQADDFAKGVWKTVNLKNLTHYIAPTKNRANMIIEKLYDHSVGNIYLRKY